MPKSRKPVMPANTPTGYQAPDPSRPHVAKAATDAQVKAAYEAHMRSAHEEFLKKVRQETLGAAVVRGSSAGPSKATSVPGIDAAVKRASE